IANRRYRPPARGAARKRGVFADHIIVANLQTRRLTTIREILRRAAERGEGKHDVVLAKRGVAFDEHMRHKTRAVAELYVRTDDATGADLNLVAELGALIDHRGG